LINHNAATITPKNASLLSTATGLMIFGENSGAFMTADTDTGEVLWKYHGNQGGFPDDIRIL